MVQAGEVAFLKTSGEAVYVLWKEHHLLNGEVVFSVRRPQSTKESGINHKLETFCAGELETFPERLAREAEEGKLISQMRQAMLGNVKAEAAALEAKPN